MAVYPQSGTLDSLAVRADATVFKFSQARQTAVLPVGTGWEITGGLAMLGVYTELVSDGYSYNEQKQLVPDKQMGGGSVQFVPLFSQQPSRSQHRPAQK